MKRLFAIVITVCMLATMVVMPMAVSADEPYATFSIRPDKEMVKAGDTVKFYFVMDLAEDTSIAGIGACYDFYPQAFSFATEDDCVKVNKIVSWLDDDATCPHYEADEDLPEVYEWNVTSTMDIIVAPVSISAGSYALGYIEGVALTDVSALENVVEINEDNGEAYINNGNSEDPALNLGFDATAFKVAESESAATGIGLGAAEGAATLIDGTFTATYGVSTGIEAGTIAEYGAYVVPTSLKDLGAVFSEEGSTTSVKDGVVADLDKVAFQVTDIPAGVTSVEFFVVPFFKDVDGAWKVLDGFTTGAAIN